MHITSTLAALGLLTLATMTNAAYVNFFGGEDCGNYFQTVNIPAGCTNLKSTALSWEIYGSGCTVAVYEGAGCKGELAPTQSGPNKCYDSPVQIKSVKATC